MVLAGHGACAAREAAATTWESSRHLGKGAAGTAAAAEPCCLLTPRILSLLPDVVQKKSNGSSHLCCCSACKWAKGSGAGWSSKAPTLERVTRAAVGLGSLAAGPLCLYHTCKASLRRADGLGGSTEPAERLLAEAADGLLTARCSCQFWSSLAPAG